MKTLILVPFSLTAGQRSHLQELVARLGRALGAIESWRLRYKRRMQFAAIDGRILRDAGISEAQRFVTVYKPFREA